MRKKFFILLAAIAALAMASCQDHIQTNAPLTLVTDAPEATNAPVSADEATPTNTPTPEATPTDVPTPEPTLTDVLTPEPTPTDVPTPEPTPTDVPTPEPTPMDAPTSEPTPTDVPETTVTPKPTDKPKATTTPKPTNKPTATPKPTEAPKQSKKVSVNATVKENEEYTDCVVEIELDKLYKLCKEDNWAEYTKEDIDANIEFWNAVEFERNHGVTIIGVKDKSVEHLVIPENVIWLFIDNDLGYSVIDTNSVNRIGKEAFKDCVNLKSVTVASCTNRKIRISIDDYAFSGCTGLETLSVYSILEVGEGAFYGCRSLKNIEFADESAGIERIHKRSFYGCSSLISVKYRGDIPDEAFAGCTSLETLELWSWCEKFGEAAFKGCKNLKLPANAFKFVTNVGNEAFYGCESIDTVVFVTDSSLPNSHVYIGDRAFYCCTGLTTLEIPYMVMSIGERAFYGCTGLKGELSIGRSVRYIGAYAFSGCSNLTSVQLPMQGSSDIIEYNFTEVNDGIFENCTSLTEVYVPYNVLKIAENAFQGCDNLNTVAVSGVHIRNAAENGGMDEFDFVTDTYYVDNWATSHGYEVRMHSQESGSSKGIQSSGSARHPQR